MNFNFDQTADFSAIDMEAQISDAIARPERTHHDPESNQQPIHQLNLQRVMLQPGQAAAFAPPQFSTQTGVDRSCER